MDAGKMTKVKQPTPEQRAQVEGKADEAAMHLDLTKFDRLPTDATAVKEPNLTIQNSAQEAPNAVSSANVLNSLAGYLRNLDNMVKTMHHDASNVFQGKFILWGTSGSGDGFKNKQNVMFMKGEVGPSVDMGGFIEGFIFYRYKQMGGEGNTSTERAEEGMSRAKEISNDEKVEGLSEAKREVMDGRNKPAMKVVGADSIEMWHTEYSLDSVHKYNVNTKQENSPQGKLDHYQGKYGSTTSKTEIPK